MRADGDQAEGFRFMSLEKPGTEQACSSRSEVHQNSSDASGPIPGLGLDIHLGLPPTRRTSGSDFP